MHYNERLFVNLYERFVTSLYCGRPIIRAYKTCGHENIRPNGFGNDQSENCWSQCQLDVVGKNT